MFGLLRVSGIMWHMEYSGSGSFIVYSECSWAYSFRLLYTVSAPPPTRLVTRLCSKGLSVSFLRGVPSAGEDFCRGFGAG